MQSLLKVAMVNSEPETRHGGISRVVRELTSRWDTEILRCEARLTSPPIPVIRTLSVRCHVPQGTDVVYLPRTGGSMALRRVNIPSVVTVHDVGFWDCEADAKALGWRKAMVLPHFTSLRWASRVVVVSGFTAQRLGLLVPAVRDRIRVIHLGVSPVFLEWSANRQQSRRIARRHFAEMTGSPLLVYAGDDAPRKNLALLLSAFSGVKKLFPKAQLIKVGRAKLVGDRARTLRVAKDLGLMPGRDVLFYEDVDDLQLAALYGASDLFVSASLYEGFGLPPLEAMATGTPVVVTNRGAFPEIVGKAATVVEPTRDAVCAAILTALSSGQGPDSASLKDFARRFSWDDVARKYLDVFQEVVDESKQGRLRGRVQLTGK